MEPYVLFIGGAMFIMLVIVLRRPSHSTERIYVPIDVPVREKIGCGPGIIVLLLFVILLMLMRG